MEGEIKKLVSIISVNWNGIDVTIDLINSINRHNKYFPVEIIVVDNGSRENPTSKLNSMFPQVKVVRSDTNLGYAAGNNLGIRNSKGDYIFLVNNDTEFTNGLIEGLVKIFDQYSDAGMVSPKFQYYHHKGTIEYAGYYPVNMLTGRNSMIGCKEKDNGQYEKIMKTPYAHGGGMMVKREVIETVGFMPELYFLYYEEFDWSEMIRAKGYSVYYQPNSLIYHKESYSTGKDSPLKTYYLTRNRILFMKRNMATLKFSLFLIYFTLFTIPKNTFVFVITGRGTHLISFWKGIVWHFNGLFKK